MKQTTNLNEISFITHGFYNALDSNQVPHPILMNQVHSTDALFITSDTLPQTPPAVDALITQTPGYMLTVKTADCAPVLLADPSSKMIAAIHAGWRGAFQGIIESTLIQMINHGACLTEIRAAIGPHIQRDSFEMGNDVYSLFPKTEACFFKTTNGILHFDFDAYVQHRLKRAGITSIMSIQDDTFLDQNYYSYRRDPQNPERQYSSIMIR